MNHSTWHEALDFLRETLDTSRVRTVKYDGDIIFNVSKTHGWVLFANCKYLRRGDVELLTLEEFKNRVTSTPQ